jgi:hypothetical protein
VGLIPNAMFSSPKYVGLGAAPPECLGCLRFFVSSGRLGSVFSGLTQQFAVLQVQLLVRRNSGFMGYVRLALVPEALGGMWSQ